MLLILKCAFWKENKNTVAQQTYLIGWIIQCVTKKSFKNEQISMLLCYNWTIVAKQPSETVWTLYYKKRVLWFNPMNKFLFVRACIQIYDGVFYLMSSIRIRNIWIDATNRFQISENSIAKIIWLLILLRFYGNFISVQSIQVGIKIGNQFNQSK